jgi:hypothetical protein
MWEREAEFTDLLLSVQQRASRGTIDALAQLAIEDHKHVGIWWLHRHQGLFLGYCQPCMLL